MTQAAQAVENTKEEKVAVVKDTKNGVTRPGAGTSTGMVWDICDLIHAESTPDKPITRAQVIKTAESHGINVSTAATQYGRWRTYTGLAKEARPVKEKPAKAAKEKAAKGKASAPQVESLEAAKVEGALEGALEGTDTAPAPATEEATV